MLEDRRPPEEVAGWKERDPITVLGRRLEDLGYMDRAAAEQVEAAINEELEESILKAEGTPSADLTAAFTNVYAEPMESMGL